MIKIKYSILTGLLFATIMFVYLAITSKMDVAVVVAVFIFLISPFIIYFKIFSKINYSVKFENINKKLVIHSGMASHFFEGITVGGTLYLFNDRLVFQTNFINFAYRHQIILFLNQIENVEFVSPFGLISNGILIKTKNNNKEQFIVNKRKIWKVKMENILK